MGLRTVAISVLVALLAASSALAELRRYETSHYILRTDVENDLADDLSRRLDLMYDEYADRLGEFLPAASEKKLEVRVFANRADYIRFGGNPNSGGEFNESNKILAAALFQQNRDYLRRTLQHEAFHQFAYYAVGPKLPLWLNEGLATVFQEGIFTGNGFKIGQVPPGRLRRLQADIAAGRLVDFRDFLAIDAKQWTENMSDESRRHAQYNQAWAMTHFLIFATDEEGEFKFRARVIDMLRALHKGAEGMAAFTEAFGQNIPGFQRRFIEYANQLTPTPEATYFEHQDALAQLLVQLQEGGREFTNVQSFREYVIGQGYEPPHRQDDPAWAKATDMPSYFKDATGHQFDSSEMFFEYRERAPMRDLVCRPAASRLVIRSRFFRADGKCQHETLVEPD